MPSMTKAEKEMSALAKRIYQDYLASKEVLKSVEPENFVAKWLIRNFEGITATNESLVWKFFLENLRYKKTK